MGRVQMAAHWPTGTDEYAAPMNNIPKVVFSDKLVAINDPVAATRLHPSEAFSTVRTAKFGQILRGLSLTPGTDPH